MEVTGKLLNVNRDWQTDKLLLTFEIDEKPTEKINFISTCEKLNLNIKEFKKKRSLDSNAYSWVLMTKIAECIGSSKEDVYEEMLQKYGYLAQDEDGYIVITIRESIDVQKLGGHWKFYKGNGKFNSYIAIKGSSDYNTSEMAKFIEQIVYEAKELGIETLPENELQRMNNAWGCK